MQRGVAQKTPPKVVDLDKAEFNKVGNKIKGEIKVGGGKHITKGVLVDKYSLKSHN